MNDPSPDVKTMARAVAMSGLTWMMLTVTACDFEVTNPGPVDDPFLDDPAAHGALVNGMERNFASGLGYVGMLGASVTREVHPAGSQGAFGIIVPFQIGLIPDDTWEQYWNHPQRARWVAEDGLRRFGEVMDPAEFESSTLVARSYLWAGYSNRLLGENMCQAVIDGGPAEPYAAFLQRAADHFTRAMVVASAAGSSEIEMAARAGRASVRAYLNDWAGAVQDAQGVPDDFVFSIAYGSQGEDEYNRIYWSSANQPYRAHTVWNTVHEDYYLATGDPRVAWTDDPEVPFGDAAVLDLGRVPWLLQLKYETGDAPIPLSKGSEMRLIEAEAALRAGAWEDALATINAVRAAQTSDLTGDPLPGWEAGSAEEVWTHLRRERAIVLWLEGRRLGDIRRWQEDGAPGELHPLEEGEAANLVQDRASCFPIPRSERETNPNIGV
jgi:starch-binding outer membrane protein, SusD/RagB family